MQQVYLDNEKKVLRQLKQVYSRASQDCAEKIRELNSRTDMQNLQTIIYQRQYQEALKKQLDGILDTLQTNQFSSIADYLGTSYEDGFIGTLYDLQGQGIPLIFPIDESQVVKALQTDTKLSKNLYKSLGEDVDYLKKSIKAELSRGIAGGSSWLDIASHIANGMNSPFNKAFNRSSLIARTEGHRIQNQAALDCQNKAKDKGADVLKQWDSTLDKRTRKAHVEADGQIVELDEYFSVGGEEMEAPGVGGTAKNVCNCRCCLLQRARWALSDVEYTKMNGDTDELVKLEESDYDKFKHKAKDIMNKQSGAGVGLGELETVYPKKHNQAISKYVQNAPEQCRKVWNDCVDDFHVLDPKYRGDKAYYSPSFDGVKLNISKAAKGSDYQTPYQVVFHEYGHHSDYILNRRYGNGDKSKAFSETYRNGLFGKTLKEEATAAIEDFAKSKVNSKAIEDRIEGMIKRGLLEESERTKYIKDALKKPVITDDVAKEFCNHIKKELTLMQRSDISDMFEPIMPKSCSYPFGVGHGSKYWNTKDNGKEGFAEMYSAMVNNPESLEQIQRFFPKSFKIFIEMLGVVK